MLTAWTIVAAKDIEAAINARAARYKNFIIRILCKRNANVVTFFVYQNNIIIND